MATLLHMPNGGSPGGSAAASPGTLLSRRLSGSVNVAATLPSPVTRSGTPARAMPHGVRSVVWQRFSALCSLLLLQSLSQFILERYEDLIAANNIIPLFLTMLVGAGGNAGNQAAVRCITGLATGELSARSLSGVMRREAVIGLACAGLLFMVGVLRVYVFAINDEDLPTAPAATTLAIAASLFCIVLVSVLVGAALPFAMIRVGLNVEHAAPAIQVIMDVSGVAITCAVCAAVLPVPPKAASAASGGGGLAKAPKTVAP